MKLSPIQLFVLQCCAAGDGTMRRYPGGFWMASPFKLNDVGRPVYADSGDPAPAYGFCDVRTIRAMESRGLLERLNITHLEWADARQITDAGRALIAG